MNKYAAAGIICTAAMALSGCVLGNSVDSLLSPPEISEEQRDIFDALKKAAGSNISLQYPRSGSYRSAFITEDIDSDGVKESVAFYMRSADGMPSDGKNDGSLRVNILDSVDGSWYSACDFAASGAAIDRVIVSQIGNSGRTQLIIGCTNTSGDKSFRSYVYSGKTLVNTYADSYTSMFVSDLDKDGFQELSVIHGNDPFTGRKAFFSLITDDGESVFSSSIVNLNDRTSEYANIAVGRVGEDTPAVFIDGVTGRMASTEIIYCINGILRNPLYLSESENIAKTVRPSEYLSMDIDLDGIVEIPTQSYFPGYSSESTDPFLITNWNVMESFEIVKKYSGYFDLNNGFCFILPNRWDRVVTVKSDSKTGDIVFLKYSGDIISSTEELVRLTAVSKGEYKIKLAQGYKFIRSRDNVYYMYRTPADTDEPLILTESEIINNFRIINSR